MEAVPSDDERGSAMFLIFGVKRLKRRLATTFALCGRCGTPAAQVLMRIGTWFSLFFVPVIPLGTKYVLTCTFCGESTKLDKLQATNMVAAAQGATAASSDHRVPQPEGVEQPPGTPPAPAES
jgi:hypothetical protein